MKLKSVQVKNFKNILDSTEVDIQSDVTCFVGKNESGKTAFLQALHRLNPAQPGFNFSVPSQYPAWLEKKHRREGANLEEFRPVQAKFELDPEDNKVLDDRFGTGTVKIKTLTLSRSYENTRYFGGYDADESKAIQHIVKQIAADEDTKDSLKALTTFVDLLAYTKTLEADADDAKKEVAAQVTQHVRAMLGKDELFSKAVLSALDILTPKFFYYADYSSLPGSIKIKELLQTNREKLDEDKLTALSLLKLAGAEDEYLVNPDYETRKRELENVANAITHEVLKYWTTNPELRVQIDITQKTEPTGNGHQTVLDEMKIRLWDDRHLLSLPFDERSSGFRWFFSFLAAFSEYEDGKTPVVLLLDEPALRLHAKGQKDFLKFIDERLTQCCQVLYSTHSPFMVQTGLLERARLVEDQGRDEGSKVTQDILLTDPDTLFPLQGALGYDIAQHLFIAPHNLVVEGTSDFTFMSVVSNHLREIGREYLDERWSVIPVGGVDSVPTFVALLGNHLDITVFIDAQKSGHQKLARLANEGYLSSKRLITAGQIINSKQADIEDLFDADDYLALYNEAFNEKIKRADLQGSDPIVSQIARLKGVDRFDHGRPADVLLRNRDKILPQLSKDTLDNFEKLFVEINRTLEVSTRKAA